MKKIYLFVIAMLSGSLGIAQNLIQAGCGQIDYQQMLEQKVPGVGSLMEQAYEEALSHVYHERQFNKRDIDDTLFRVKVVFHILYSNDRERIPEEVMFRQLQILNDGFRHTHEDTALVSNNFRDIAGDTRIQFDLVDKDLQGNTFNGLNYVPTTRAWFFGGLSGDRDEFMKFKASGGVDVWDPDQYLNVWICNMSDELGRVFTLGYARPPFGAANWPSSSFNYSKSTDGVVLHYEIVGDPVLNTTHETGSHTLIHEVGHYLGLRHTWGDAPNVFQGCNVDDGIDDTPNSRQANRGCNLQLNSCIEAQNDKPDNVENYMDYTAAFCTRMFTIKQREMMRYNLLRFRRGITEPVLPDYIPEKYDTLDLNIAIFPNPAINELVVSYPNATEPIIIKTEIHDMSGRKVLERKDILQKYSVVPVGTLASGMYVVSVTDPNRNLLVRSKIVFTGG